jgi:hypothetical protein
MTTRKTTVFIGKTPKRTYLKNCYLFNQQSLKISLQAKTDF